MVLFTVDLLMSLHAPNAAPPPPSSNVVVVSGPAVAEQPDLSEVVIKKPMPSPTGVQ